MTDPWRATVGGHCESDEVVAKVEREIQRAQRPIAATSQVRFTVRQLFEFRPRTSQRDRRVVLRGRVKLVERDPEQFRASRDDVEYLLEFDD